MDLRLSNSGFPEFAQFFFNSIPDDDFVTTIYRLRYGIGVGYNGTRCYFPSKSIEGSDRNFEGVAFSLFGDRTIVDNDEFDSMVESVCNVQKRRCPDQGTAIDAALRQPARYRQRIALVPGHATLETISSSLFRPKSASTDISANEDLRLLEVDERAYDLDQLTTTSKTPGNLAHEASLRRTMLAGLESRGLLSPEHAEAKLFWLDVWAMSKLASYFHATLALEAYRTSAARRSRFPESSPDAKPSVSLDWFRNGIKPPPGRDADAWLALCEHTLLDAIARGRITSSPPSYEGELFERTKAGWFELRWRRDDGETPVVVSAKLS